MVAKSLDDSQRRELLEHLEKMNPDADVSPENIARIFLPLPEYKRVLDDRVVLVLGDRGVGKSALFHFLQTKARAELEPSGVAHEWVVGFSESGVDHPAPLILEQLVSERATAESAARSFWLGHLAGRLAQALEGSVPPPVAYVRWKESPTDPSQWIAAFADPTQVLLWFDRVEGYFRAKNQVLVVTYDHLDRIGVRNRDARRQLLPPLLALWLSLSNRYRALRAKIFLRQDLFRESVPQTSDVSKLQARAETIHWTKTALYRLLLRHFASTGEPLRDWMQKGVKGIPLKQDELLGWLPPEDFPETGTISQQAFMEHLVGSTMGNTTDPRAGYPHRWVLARLADANAAIAPRSMVTLFWSAARHALTVGPRAGYLRLLTPEEMKEGLRETSDRRVAELVEEHPVVERLKQLVPRTLPLKVQDAVQLLSNPLPDDPDRFGDSGARVLEELERLGVIARVAKERIDVPDIYRLRFGVQRTGQKVAAVHSSR
jgi:hypothetical protein